jgi:hypothetical protein
MMFDSWLIYKIYFRISLLTKYVLDFVLDFISQSQHKLIIEFYAVCNFSKINGEPNTIHIYILFQVSFIFYSSRLSRAPYSSIYLISSYTLQIV